VAKALSSGISSGLIHHSDFVKLINGVLDGIDRAPLPANGPERTIIEIRPDEKVLQILAGAGSGKTEMLVWRVLYELCAGKWPLRVLPECPVGVARRSCRFSVRSDARSVVVEDRRCNRPS